MGAPFQHSMEEALGPCSLPMGSFTLVKDELGTSGSFLVPYLLKKALSAGEKVCVVGVEHQYQHYQQVMKKLGTSVASGNFRFVDCVLKPFSWLEGKDQTGEGGGVGAVEEMYGRVVQHALTDLEGQRATILVDSLPALEVLLADHRGTGTAELVRQLRAACMQRNASLVVVGGGAGAGVGADASGAANGLEHLADMVLHVEGIGSGAGLNVHGMLTATRRSDKFEEPWSQAPSDEQLPRGCHWQFQYKLMENGFRFGGELT